MLLAKTTANGSSSAFGWAPHQHLGPGLVQVIGQQSYAGGRITAPASFGSQSIGTTVSVQPSFLPFLTNPAPLPTPSALGIGTVSATITLYGSNLAGTLASACTGTSGNMITTGFTVNAAGT